MPELDLVLILLLAAFAAGFVDAIAGGGGMITVPVLLLSGLDPLTALGTNKLQALFGTGSAVIAYGARGQIGGRALIPAAILAFLGAVAGALLAQALPTSVLELLLPFLLIAIALFFALKPGLSDVATRQRIGLPAFGFACAVPIGAYDGLFGPGAGAFFMLAFVTLLGFGVLKAAASTKLVNFASNLGAFVVFAGTGSILWTLGLLMGAAQFAGARLGAALAVRFGARLIRPLVVVVCLALATRLLWDT